MQSEERVISQFLADHHLADVDRLRLPADASFRRYERLAGSDRLLMIAPPDREPLAPFVAIAQHLRRLGLAAPAVFAWDAALGLALIEDLGDDTFTRLLAAGHDERALYSLAIDTLAHLHLHPEATALALPAYTATALWEEARLFIDWFLPAIYPDRDWTAAVPGYEAVWRAVLGDVPDHPRSLVLRDFHVDNLMLCGGGADGIAACGLLDFQDARIGHPAYDLMSLLEDARRDIESDLITAMCGRYHAANPHAHDETFATAYHVLAAQRHSKVAGIFLRLWLRDGKPGYLAHMPRVLRLLRTHLDQPELRPLHDWMQQHAADFDAPRRFAPELLPRPDSRA